MPSRQKFDYAVFHNGKAPIVPIELWGERQWHKVWFYVDSGARFTVLHTFEARRLGVDLKTCEKHMFVGAGNKKIPVYMKRIRLRVGKTVFTAPVGFCNTLGSAFNLLGRTGVFDRFKVSFNDKAEVITFEKT